MGLTPAGTADGRWHVDGAACGIDGDRVFAIAEERLSRTKREGGSLRSVRLVLNQLGIEPSEVTTFVLSTCGEPVPHTMADTVINREAGTTLADLGVKDHQVRWLRSHHLSHALEAWSSRPCDSGLVLVADDAGSGSTHGDTLERTSLFQFCGSPPTEPLRWLRTPRGQRGSYGSMYSSVTEHIGFDGQAECGTVMGLAAYGLSGNTEFDLLEKAEWAHIASTSTSTLARRRTGDVSPYEISFQESANLAHRAQRSLELAVQELLKREVLDAGAGLLMSGGVALNCKLAGFLVTCEAAPTVHVGFAPGDTGQAIGNAVAGLSDGGETFSLRTPFLGPVYSQRRLDASIRAWGEGLQVTERGVHRATADLLAEGRVVATFLGRSEFGPRALGARTILADARRPDMRDHLNRRVKSREWFRPYGLAVLAEALSDVTDIAIHSPYMMIAVPANERGRARFPAAVHVDGSVRIQTVSGFQNPCAALLRAFHDRTGSAALVNTSFNLAGEPIVETPDEALAAFRSMNIDALLIGDTLLQKAVVPEKSLY